MGSQLDPLPLSRVGSRERLPSPNFPQLHFGGPPSGFTPRLGSASGRVSVDDNEGLVSSLSMDEVVKAIRAFPKGKAPSHDGIPMEFFHECEQEIASDLHQAFTTMLNEGETFEFINKGIITLIPKSGDHAHLNN